jgi:hypothetical protein
MSITELCAWTFVIATTMTILFQMALACGAPWGEWTLGGRHHGVLPGRWRLVPVVSIVLLAAFAAVVAARAHLAFPEWHGRSMSLIWVVVAYSALGCVANAATRSPRERRLWLPVVCVMLVTSAVVAGS